MVLVGIGRLLVGTGPGTSISGGFSQDLVGY